MQPPGSGEKNAKGQVVLKLMHTSKALPRISTSPGLPLLPWEMPGGRRPISCLVHVAVGLSTLSHCRESQASQDLSDAKASTALRWVCPASPPLLFGIFWPLHSPCPFPALSPGRNGPSWLARAPGPQGTLVGTCTGG